MQVKLENICPFFRILPRCLRSQTMSINNHDHQPRKSSTTVIHLSLESYSVSGDDCQFLDNKNQTSRMEPPLDLISKGQCNLQSTARRKRGKVKNKKTDKHIIII